MQRTLSPPRVLVTLALVAGLLSAARVTRPSPAARGDGIAGLTWLSGTWVRDDGGQHLEETWSAATDYAMIGMFRWARQEKVWLYELMSIESENHTLVFRLRHFNRELEPWKSEAAGPLTYPLLLLTENEVVFEDPERDEPRRFIYSREGDELTVRLEKSDGSGDSFRFTRVD